jgi:hypothetical protein
VKEVEGGRRRVKEDEGGRRRMKEEDEGGGRRRRTTEEDDGGGREAKEGGEGGRRRRKAKEEGEGGRRRTEDEGHRPWDHSLVIVGRKHQGGEPKARTGTQGEQDGETRTVLFQVDIQTEELQSKYRIYIRSERAEFPEREKQKD